MKIQNELVKELDSKLKGIEDPIDFINSIDKLDAYISKAKYSSKYDKAREKLIICDSCKKMFLKEGAKTTTDTKTRNVCTYSSPWGDDREYENRAYKESYYICPRCHYKNLYAEEVIETANKPE